MTADAIIAFAQLSFGGQFLLVMLAGCIVRVILLAITRFYRMVMVMKNGWPPDHLDADGDWKLIVKEK